MQIYVALPSVLYVAERMWRLTRIVACRASCNVPPFKIYLSLVQIYVALPFVLYVAERVWRLIRNVAFKGDLLDVELLPGRGRNGGGGVTVLRMRRPRDFNYRSRALQRALERLCL